MTGQGENGASVFWRSPQGKDRVVLIGIAQEKASVWRSWKSRGQEKTAHPHMVWGRQMAYINHIYLYL
jgi:hypothetical protein